MQAKNRTAPGRPARITRAAGVNPVRRNSVVVRTELFTIASGLKDEGGGRWAGGGDRAVRPPSGLRPPPASLHLDRRALLLELGSDRVRLVLRDAGLDGL